jgi:hypothetical protein
LPRGVPLQVGEGAESYRSFRLGLFGLDKLKDVDGNRSTAANGGVDQPCL